MPTTQQTFIIKGQITNPEGDVLSGFKVIAKDKTRDKEAELGIALTNEAGDYEISCSIDQLCLKGVIAPDIQLQVFESDGNQETHIATSSLHVLASSPLGISLVVEPLANTAISEYESIADKIRLNTPVSASLQCVQ